MQNLVVLGHGNAEDDRGHVLETVDPLLTLRPLASNVEQPKRKRFGSVLVYYTFPNDCGILKVKKLTKIISHEPGVEAPVLLELARINFFVHKALK